MFAHALAGHHTFDFLKVLQISSFSWNFVKGVGPADDLGMAKEENITIWRLFAVCFVN